LSAEERKPSLPTDEFNRKWYWDFRKNAWYCLRCNNCKWIDNWEVKDARFARICPSNAYYLFDTYAAQGRMDVSLDLIDGVLKYEDDPEILDILYACNTCGGCDVMCKGVHDMSPINVILEMRAKMVEDGQLLPQYLPILESLRREDNTMLGKKADRGKWAEGLGIKNLAEESAEVAFFTGCRFSFDEELWKIPRAIAGIFKDAGVDFGIMGKDENCCGSRPAQMGFKGEFTKYAENNIDAWKNAGVKTVVTACSDGYYAMKRLYPEVGSKVEVLHMVEFLARLIEQGKIKLTKKVPMKVTYHDPCHLGRRLSQAISVFNPNERSMGIYEPPRDIIKAIPGVEMVEMFRNRECAWCCGAGGGVIDTYPDFNSYTATQRIIEAQETGAEAIVTACPWCERSLGDAIKETGAKIKVIDLVELVDSARQRGGK